MNHQSQKTKLHSILIAITFLAFSGVPMVQAGGPWELVRKITAADGSANNLFGFSVAISSNLAVIGAISGDGNVTESGSAYMYDVITGQQLFMLMASDGATSDGFGSSVSINGNIVVIGAPADDDKGSGSGSAYVFDETTGQQLFKLLPSDGAADDIFGISVSLSGNLAIIGASGDDDKGSRSGSAYVFDVTTGQQLFKLLASDGAESDEFGRSVAMTGNLAVIGSKFDDDNGTDSGSAYIFDVTTGQQLFKLLASDGDIFDNFGNSVSINGDLAVIGASLNDVFIGDSGSAYVFDVNTGQQIFELLASDKSERDQFGSSVALSGNLAVIGAVNDSDNGQGSGSAYVFDVTTGQQLVKFLPNDGAANNQFGNSVSIDKNMMLIGSFRDDAKGIDSGSAYVFQQRNTNLLTVSPLPLIGKQKGTFSIIQALPNEQTWLIYSLDGIEQTFFRPLNIVIDLANPKIAVGPRLTDANGDREIIITMPGILNPIDVWFQAVQNNNVTNFIPTQLIP